MVKKWKIDEGMDGMNVMAYGAEPRKVYSRRYLASLESLKWHLVLAAESSQFMSRQHMMNTLVNG